MTPFSSCIVFLWLLLIIWYDFWSHSSSKNSDRNKEPLQVPKAQLCNLTSKRVQWVLWCFMAFTPQSLASLEMQIMWTWIRQSARSCPQHVKETFSMLCWTLLMTLNHPKSLRTRTLGDCCKKVTWLTWAVSLANDRTIYSTAIMPRIFPWCLMHPKSTLLWESEDVRGRLYWHCTGCSKLWQWYNVDQCGTWWIILVHLGTSYSQRHEAKSCNGCWTTRVISNVSNYRCHAHELLNLLKASFASDSIFHTCSKQNQDEPMSSRSSRVHSFADFCYLPLYLPIDFHGFGWTTKCSSTHRYSDHSASWLSFSGTPAATNPSKPPQPTQGPGGPGAFEFLFGKLWHLV